MASHALHAPQRMEGIDCCDEHISVVAEKLKKDVRTYYFPRVFVTQREGDIEA